VVDVRSGEASSQRLVAYLAAEAISRSDLKKALRTTLPDAMIPYHFVFLPSLPVTSNGKVDHAALARLPLDAAAPGKTAAPVTAREKEMTALWERNLDRRSIGLDQDYFELGGDSLSAVNLLAAIEKQLGQKLKLSVLLDHSTIADLLAALENPASRTNVADFKPTCEILPIQESGDGMPLVVLTGGTGSNLVHYKNFARKFAPDHPVYALQYPYALLLDKPENPLDLMVETIADHVLTVAAGRPFVLFGHCLGGLLAWHVAVVLQKRTAPPFRLVIYAPPASEADARSAEHSSEAGSPSRLRRLLNAYRPAWQEWQMDHGASWWTYLKFARWVLTNFLERRGWIRTKQDPYRFVKLTYLRLIERSPLPPYSGDALVIHHVEEVDAAAKSLWPSLCSQAQIEYVPGYHRVWQNAILSILPLVRERLQSLLAPDSAIT
jgi:acyl carrier protein